MGLSRAGGGRGSGRGRPEPTPAQRALGLLVRREHSRRELERKLAARGVPADDAAQTVARMTAEGWQDDRRFAASLARARAAGGYGPLRIRAELESHGLDAAVVESAFAALAEDGDDDWAGRARALVSRRFGVDSDRDAPDRDAPGEDAATVLARRRKAAEYLLRRGYDIGTVRRATGFAPED